MCERGCMNIIFTRLHYLLASKLVLFALMLIMAITISVAQSQPSHLDSSPDNLWQKLDRVDLPRDYLPPTSFTAWSLDAPLLQTLLMTAPRENFETIPPQTQAWLPLPTGKFDLVSLANSRLMEPALLSQFPGLKTYVYAGNDVIASGHLATGPSGAHFTAQTNAGMLQIEPVETASGRVYLSFYSKDKTDGTNIEVHDPEMGENEDPPVPLVAMLNQSLANNELALAAIEAGNEFRIYRFAASTTGEFYQARDTGNGLIDVIFSLLVDIIGANAVFEPEVSVRLILAATSLNVLYSDPAADPFDNSDSACTLREDNRDNMKAVLDNDDYDLGFLFAARAGGGANGCAWFVVCLNGNTVHKARGAGLMGGNGTNSSSGLLAHEVGHMLGARHTFSGQAGKCTMNEFNVGNSESGYEPGSGTTRMSYRGICDSDNVDTNVGNGAVAAGSYFHSRSFDEIVDNVFSGDGSSCGNIVMTANMPPSVDAGPDFTIPQETPFMLTGIGNDDEPLLFNWEQFDRAIDQRPIDTDPGDGPIIRSIPPTGDSSRIIPNLQDLLDGVSRKGEILPTTNRTLNFRLIARDSMTGSGGVAYDEMEIDVQGEPFMITSPNSGSFEAACEVPLTWQVGGGSVAAQVEALFADDGGLNFNTALTGAIANDGSDSFIMPCQLGTEGRIKLQSVGNIFFDVNDENLTVFNNPPAVEVATAGGSVDDACEFTVVFNGTVTDQCGVNAADVSVDLIKAMDNFALGVPNINIAQFSQTEVQVSGSVLVSDLQNSPAQLAVKITAADACGAMSDNHADAEIVDDIPPEIDVTVDSTQLWPPNHKLVPIQANVIATDNCPGVSYVLTSVASNEPENGIADGNTAPDITDVDVGTTDLEFSLRSERAGNGNGRVYTVTYTAQDGSNNEAEDEAAVKVGKSKKK